jgi:arylsulfatase A
MDLYTTGAKLAGATVPADRAIDGLDISRLLIDSGEVEREAFFYYRGTDLCAARVGNWKANFITQSAYGKDVPEKHNPPALYDLENDPGERFDVAAGHADVIEKIRDAVATHQAGMKPAPTQLEAVVEAR